MSLYAIDPGTEQSALVVCQDDGTITGEIVSNESLRRDLRMIDWIDGHLVVEQIESYGMAVGREVFETVFWSGRFIEAWGHSSRLHTWSLLPRRDVKLTLCGSMKAKDANIRQALLDRFGGKEKAIGKKAAPGPLYGMRSHCWAALALAVTYQETQKAEVLK
jgi:hypothetical protein